MKTAEQHFNERISKKSRSDFQGAIEDFTLALRGLDTDKVYFNRGNAKMYLRDNRGALADYKLGLKKNSFYLYVPRANIEYAEKCVNLINGYFNDGLEKDILK